ncbi:tyrosine-type recombinase/integrase [Anaerorhabdus furcosa]|uniref:Integrase/recombinase XerD n=1 Tax=Anaerorhabdus furcosa TaxID=118967 RepID=A0A1T4M3L6_9FIRM|nr:tyrosine-type recombinase/integrase [Anaerorhabdus furcosa]SJZ61466.1 integrase/recombinase XerD [Anaerorhabdus furcosa]
MDLDKNIELFLKYCKYQKNLNFKTLKAYKIDLKQFRIFIQDSNFQISKATISNYIYFLHGKYKAKSSKRKIATVKCFFNFLEYEEIYIDNPFSKLRLKSQIPFILPKTISIQTLNRLFKTAYSSLDNSSLSEYETICIHRDIAVLELLFATGLRVSELCSIKKNDIDLVQGIVKVYGKGSKERIIQLTNSKVITALSKYREFYKYFNHENDYFFINKLGNKLSEQSIRFMINKYVILTGITEHITPHMFRHTFATLLLEEDVDIRYIQQILGHSSIITTQIYTHVTSSKQREILTYKHPRNRISI